MSIYSCNISNVSRAKGSSSCATLSYISAEIVREDRTKNIYQYGRGERVILVETRLPEGAPERYQDPKVLFNEIESYEKASNARTAKKIMVALPIEFDLLKQKEVLDEYIQDNLTKQGYACTYAIHADNENKNPHVHILIANRALNANGKWSTKSKKTYALDADGQRVPLIDPNTGEQKLGKRNEKLWKRVDVQVNLLDQKEMLEQLREQWAEVCNKRLGPENQIDHRTLAAQGKDIEPTIHEGYVARKIEENGGISNLCEENRQIKERNSLIKEIQNLINKLLQLRKEEQEVCSKGTLLKTSIRPMNLQKSQAKLGAWITNSAKNVSQAIQEAVKTEPKNNKRKTAQGQNGRKKSTTQSRTVFNLPNNVNFTQFDHTMRRYGVDYAIDNTQTKVFFKSQDVDDFTQAWQEYIDTMKIATRPSSLEQLERNREIVEQQKMQPREKIQRDKGSWER